jgi:hypothetical protein
VGQKAKIVWEEFGKREDVEVVKKADCKKKEYDNDQNFNS